VHNKKWIRRHLYHTLHEHTVLFVKQYSTLSISLFEKLLCDLLKMISVMLSIYSLVKRTFENQLPWREEVNRNRRTKSNYGLTTDSFIQAHERGKIERQAAGFNKNERKTRDLAFLQNSFVYIFYLHIFTVFFNAFSCSSKQHFQCKLSE